MPLSEETIASLSSNLFRFHVTTCGFIGISLRVPRTSISWFQLFIFFCAFSRKLLSCFSWIRGKRARSTDLHSPTNPTSTGWRSPMRAGSMSI